mgnify:CR=1 FL=1
MGGLREFRQFKFEEFQGVKTIFVGLWVQRGHLRPWKGLRV